MAIKTFYILNSNAVAPGYFGQMQDGGSAPSAASTAYGWGVGKTSTAYWRARLGATGQASVAQASSNIDATSAPQKGTGAGSGTAGDSFISPSPYSGAFAAGNWTFNFVMRTGAATNAGRIRCQVWAGANADGTGARKLTSATLVGATVSMSSTTTDYNSTVTWDAPAITLANEYLFLQVEWNVTTTGSSNSCSALFRSGTSRVVTTDFVAAIAGTGALVSARSIVAGVGAAVSGVSGTGALQAVAIKDRANLLPSSDQFDQWNYNAITFAVDVTSGPPPDWLPGADKLIATATDNSHNIGQMTSYQVAGTDYCYSVYLQQWLGPQWIQLYLDGSWANFNIGNGTVGNVNLPGGATASIEDSGNGWYRCSIWRNQQWDNQAYVAVCLLDSNVSVIFPVFTPQTDIEHYVFGAQVEPGRTPTAYIKTGYTVPVVIPGGVLHGVGDVSTPPAIGTGALKAQSAAAYVFGISSSTGTGGGAAAPIIVDQPDLPLPVGQPGWNALGQSFLPTAGTITSIKLKVTKNTAATNDALQIQIIENFGFNSILGTIVRYVDDLVVNTATDVTFVFPTPLTVSIGKSYSINVSRTGALDSVNFCTVAGAGSDIYSGGVFTIYDGEKWTPQPGWDLNFTLYMRQAGGLVATPLVRSNYLTWSEELEKWAGGSLLKSPDAVVAPDGNLTAERFTDDSTNTAHYLYTTAFINNQTTTFSVYAKAGTISWLQLHSFSTTEYYYNFNIAAGTLGVQNSGGGVSAVITPVGNGWYRCSMTMPSCGNNPQVYCMPINADIPGYSWQGTGAYLDLWGAQLDLGAVAGAYIKTGVSVVVGALEVLKGAGDVSWNATGALLAGTLRTNYIPRSQDLDNAKWGRSGAITLAVDAAVAPDNSMTAERMTLAVGNCSLILTNSVPAPSGDYALSFYVKAATSCWVQLYENGSSWANFNALTGAIGQRTGGVASAVDVGNGWWRCQIASPGLVTPLFKPQFYLMDSNGSPGQNNSVAGLVLYLWGVQYESGRTTPSAYIQTGDTAVTVGTTPPSLAGVGTVITPPAIGVGTLASTTAAMSGFGAVRSTGTGALAASPIILRMNLVPWSQDIDRWQWNGIATMDNNAALAPDGTMTAEILHDHTSTSAHCVRADVALPSAGEYTASFYAKAGTLNWVQLYFSAGGAYRNFNLTTGVVGNGSGIIAAIADAGGGWWRCSIKLSSVVAPTASLYIALLQSDVASAIPTWTGTGSGTVSIWGAQLEQGPAWTPYIPTTAVPGYVYNVLSGVGVSQVVATGVLKAGSRTNFVLRSQEVGTAPWGGAWLTVTPDTVVAPDSTQTADTLTEGAVNAQHYIQQNFDTPVSKDGAHTLSAYFKAGTGTWIAINVGSGSNTYANFNVVTGVAGLTNAAASKIEAVGNGWFRCSVLWQGSPQDCFSVSFIALHGNDTNTTYLGTGLTWHIWGVQFEDSASALGYIPTTTAPVSVGGLQRTNYMLQSQALNVTPWVASSIAMVANATAAPDSTITAEKVTTDGGSGAHYFSTSAQPMSAAPGGITLSIYAKADTATWFQLRSSGPVVTVNFNIAAGVVGLQVGATGSIVALPNGWYRCAITFPWAADGSPSFSVLMMNDDSANIGFLNPGLSAFFWGAQAEFGTVATGYLPTTTSIVSVPATVISGAGVSSSRSTSGALQAAMPPLTMGGGVSSSESTLGLLNARNPAITGAGLGPSWVGSGALQALPLSRTNYWRWSQDFDNAAWSTQNVTVAANTVQAPDGTLTADTVTDTTGNQTHSLVQTTPAPLPGAGSNTCSIYVKAGTGTWFQIRINDGVGAYWANFNIVAGTIGLFSGGMSTQTITPLADGWYRCSLIFPNNPNGNTQVYYLPMGSNAGGGNPIYPGLGSTWHLWGAQIESGSAAGGYIPSGATAGSQQTTLVGKATATWLASGALTSGVAHVTGAGVNSWTASGSITAQLATLTGVAVSISFGTGALVASDTVVMEGTGWAGYGAVGAGEFFVGEAFITSPIGYSSSSGVGALTSHATIVAPGVGSSSGAGALVVPGVASVAGVGVVGSVGTAALVAKLTPHLLGDGIAQHVITGALAAQRATTAAIGLVEQGPEGPGVFVAQTAKVAALGTSSWVASGTLTASFSAVGSFGFVRWSGPGILTAGAAVIAGTAISSSVVTRGDMSSSYAGVNGIEGIEVILGFGDPRAQSASLVSYGGTLASGTGALFDAASALAGAGFTRSLGTGAPISQASVISGAGISSVAGSGEIVAQRPTVAGDGIIIPAPTGTGALSSSVGLLHGLAVAEMVANGTMPAQIARVTGVGIARAVADGALVAGEAALAGVAVSATRGTGTIQPPRAAVEGEGISSVAGAGALPSGRATLTAKGIATQYGAGEIEAGAGKVSGAGFVQHRIGPQAIEAQAAQVVAIGVSSSAATKAASLQAARATVEGVQGVMVTTGSGDLRPAQPARVYAFGAVANVGTGSLSVADSSTVNGSGYGQSRGSGVLPSSKVVIEGGGRSVSRGTGEIYSPSRQITTIGGRAFWAGSGELLAGEGDATGAGLSQSRGSGVVRGDLARLAGVGTVSVSGAATLRAGPAKVTAVAILTTQGTGALAANDNVIVGKGDQRSTGFGVLITGFSELEGEPVSGSVGTGEIIARNALMLAFGRETAYGDGVLVANDAVIDGSNLVEGAGVIEAGACEVVGIGEIGWPVLREPDPMPGSYPGTRMWKGATAAPTLPPPPWWLRAA